MYESESNTQYQDGTTINAKQMCQTPPSGLRMYYLPVESFDKGYTVGMMVDGVLCLSKEDAIKVFADRLKDLCAKWEQHISKM